MANRLPEIRTLTVRETAALGLLFHGLLGQPLNSGRPVTHPTHAIRYLLHLVADAAGIPAVHFVRAPVPEASAAGGR